MVTYHVIHTEPNIKERDAQHYIGIRTQVPMNALSQVIPQLIDETEAWLQKRSTVPSGPAFIRYHVIDMDNLLDIEVGWPVDTALIGDDRVTADILPSGRYVSLVYQDVSKGIEGNAVLIEWAHDNHLQFDSWESSTGEAFRCRVEVFLDGPEEHPDPAQWRTEVAIKLAEA